MLTIVSEAVAKQQISAKAADPAVVEILLKIPGSGSCIRISTKTE